MFVFCIIGSLLLLSVTKSCSYRDNLNYMTLLYSAIIDRTVVSHIMLMRRF